MNYHKIAKTKEEWQKIIDMNYKQSNESINIIKKITCICNNSYEPFFMFRCYYCGLWLCAKCAKEHFGERPKGKNNIVKIKNGGRIKRNANNKL